jgi:hypothetical protein
MATGTSGIIGSYSDRAWAEIERLFSGKSRTVRALPALFLIAIVCRLPSLTAFSISIDDEFTSWRSDPTVWAQQGRWVNWLLESFVIDQACVPIFTDLLFCVSVTVSYVLLLQAHRIFLGPLAWLAFPLFCAYPQWDLIGEFYGNVPGVACGLACVSLGAALFHEAFVRRGKRAGLTWMGPLIALLVATATGCYQSFLLMFVAVGLGVILRAQLSSRPVPGRAAAGQLFALAAVSIAALVIHQAMSAAILRAVGAQSVYVESLIDVRNLQAKPFSVVARTAKEVLRTLLGAGKAYGMSIWGAALLVAAGWGALLTSDGTWRPTRRKWLCVALAAGCCLVPFSLHPLAAAVLPQRMLVAIPYVVWLFAVLPHILPRSVWRLVGAAGLLITTTQVLYLASTSAAARELTAIHDRQLAADLYRTMTALHPDFDVDRTYSVAFVGAKPYFAPRYVCGPCGTARGSFFWWGGGDSGRIVAFMRLLGYANLVTAPSSELQRIRSEARGMPDWPAAGSVRVVDGTTVFKLGPTQ